MSKVMFLLQVGVTLVAAAMPMALVLVMCGVPLAWAPAVAGFVVLGVLAAI